MADLSFAQVFTPVKILLGIIPVYPFSSKNGIKFSKVKIIQIFVHLLLYAGLTLHFSGENTTQRSPEFSEIKMISFVIVFRTFANIAVMVIVYLMTFVGFRKFATELNKSYSVDQQLRKLDFLGHLSKSNRSVRDLTVLLAVVVHVGFNILGFALSVALRNFDSMWTVLGIYVITVFPRLVIGNINLVFYVVIMLLTHRFKVINNDIVKKVDDSKTARKYPCKIGFCDEMRFLVDLHKSLVKVAKEINAVYGVYLLLFIATTFVLLVGDLYITMYTFLFHLSGTSIIGIVLLFKNILMYVFDLFILAKFSSDLCEEANSTKRLIVRIKIDIDKEDERNSVIVGALKLGQNNLDITACRFFNIDNALLFSICGAASSYLFIMIQLDLGNMNSTETNTSVTELFEYFNATTIYK